MSFLWKNLFKLSSQTLRQCESKICSSNFSFFNVLSELSSTNQKQNFHTSTPRRRKVDVELEIRKAAKESSRKTLVMEDFSVESEVFKNKDLFPTSNLLERLFDGVPFKDLPIINIKVSRNNTILSLSDGNSVKLIRSCGMEGFKNSRKGTNIAAQAAGSALGIRALKRGYKNVRVVIKGLGPGRLSGVKGLQLSGMNVISVTDETKASTHCRPRKQRRI